MCSYLERFSLLYFSWYGKLFFGKLVLFNGTLNNFSSALWGISHCTAACFFPPALHGLDPDSFIWQRIFLVAVIDLFCGSDLILVLMCVFFSVLLLQWNASENPSMKEDPGGSGKALHVFNWDTLMLCCFIRILSHYCLYNEVWCAPPSAHASFLSPLPSGFLTLPNRPLGCSLFTLLTCICQTSQRRTRVLCKSASLVNKNVFFLMLHLLLHVMMFSVSSL